MAKDVKIFALSTCVHCRRAQDYLDECGVKYDCVHVDQLNGAERDQVIEELKKHNPSLSFPTLLIDGCKVVVGFDEAKIKELLES